MQFPKSDMSQPRCQLGRKRILTTKPNKNGLTITSTMPLMLHQLNDWRADGFLCDIRIKVADGVICAHKNILAVNSEYFLAMFTSGMKESTANIISMEILNHHPMKMLVDFMYTGEIEVTTVNAPDLVILSDMLQMDHLKKQCELFMLMHMEAKNCLGMFEFGRQYSCPELVKKAMSLVKKGFPMIINNEELADISSSTLREILLYEDLYLGPRGEDVVLEAAIRWLEHDAQERKVPFIDIISNINLCSISPAYLQKILQMAVIREDPETLDILQNTPSLPVKCMRVPQQFIYAIGGFIPFFTERTRPRAYSVERFDVQTHEWTSVAPLPLFPRLVYAFNMQGRLLVVAFDPPGKGFFEYNYLEDEWSNITGVMSDQVFNLLEDTVELGSITFCTKNNCLYLLNRRSFSRISIEEIDSDIVVQNIKHLNPLPSAANTSEQILRGVSLVPHEGNVYSIGGLECSSSQFVLLDSVYMYDYILDTWISKKSMISLQGHVGAVSLEGKIFVLGGFAENRETKMEVYNPTTDTWESQLDIQKRYHFCAVAAAGKVWAIGGTSTVPGSEGERLKTIEMYDPDSDVWTDIKESMRYARCEPTAAVL